MPKLTKASALRAFKQDILPGVKARYERDGKPDVPARCEAWNDYTDSLREAGCITEEQYSTWTNPF